MPKDKPCLFYLDAGYKYEPHITYELKLALLSERFAGAVVTFGKAGRFQFGDFTVYSFRVLRSKLIMFLRAYWRARQIIRSMRRTDRDVDIIVTYDPLNTGLLGLLLAWEYRKPMLIELNGDYTDWSNYEHIGNPFMRRIKRWLYMRIATFVLSRASGIKLMYETQLESYGRSFSDKVVRVFPNFLDLQAFRNLGETRKVLVVGFPFRVKGIDIAVAAFKRIADEFPDWKMEILGWYPGEEKLLLDECIGQHPQIEHHKPVLRRDMPDYMGRCGVVVCSSRTEGFPRVIKEAMYSAKPCIVSNVGGLPDAIENGVTGLLFQKEDVDGLAAQLRRLLSNRDLRMSLGQEAQRFAQREYANEAYLDHVHKHCLQILPDERVASKS